MKGANVLFHVLRRHVPVVSPQSSKKTRGRYQFICSRQHESEDGPFHVRDRELALLQGDDKT